MPRSTKKTQAAESTAIVAPVVEVQAVAAQVVEEPAELPDSGARRVTFEIPLGEPFAISHDSELLDDDTVLPSGNRTPGTFATLRCSCGTIMRINLLGDELKECPNAACRLSYTHVLLIGRADDAQLSQEFVDLVLDANFGDSDDADDDDAGDGDDDDHDSDDGDGDDGDDTDDDAGAGE